MTASPVQSAPMDAALRRPAAGGRNELNDFMAGQMVSIKVQQRLDEQHYVVVLRGESRKVAAEKPLPVGETIDAIVVRAAEKLELRQVAAGATTTRADSPVMRQCIPNETDLVAMASFHKCELTLTDRTILQAAVDHARTPADMVMAGLFLNKRGLPLQPALLNALYALQGGAVNGGILLESVRATRVEAQPITIRSLAQVFAQVLEIDSDLAGKEPTDASIETNAECSLDSSEGGIALTLGGDQRSAPDTSAGKHESRNVLARLLRDGDADGTGMRYGTLPLLIDGRLVELELVLLQQRQRESEPQPLRRLVMSIHTATLGIVEITAEALGNRLLIRISGETTDHAQAMAAYAAEVRTLAERFGWRPESVGYEVRTSGGRLARQVIEHTVRQGSIDHVW